MIRTAIATAIFLMPVLAACSSAPVRTSLQLDPGRRAVITLMPTVEEILVANRGPGVVQMDLEDTNLLVFMAMTFRSGDRHTYREPSLARIRLANESDRSALIEFTIWGGGEEGFELEVAPAPAQLPENGTGL